VQRTTNWARRSLDAHDRDDQALFGIVQGGTHDELRRRSAEEVGAMGFAGFAIGGVSVGESPAEMRRVVELTAPRLPEDRPRYVMGVGRPEDLVDMVGAGIDLFDCVLPTRNARNATLFTRSGTVRIKGAAHARDPRALEEGCPCYTCTHFSRGYLRHLYHQNEILAAVLGTLHNLSFYQNLMADLRRAIGAGRYVDFRSAFHTVLKGA
jgi:queuine tRNA-ribosyltransferase